MNTDQLELDIHEIKKDNPAYPGRMKSLSNMPDTLYYTGKLPSDGRPACAIIGARLCSPYGREAAYSFARILSKEGVQIISGMAVGIDGYAQEGALDAGGDTFAVLGSGVAIPVPTVPYTEGFSKMGASCRNCRRERRHCPIIFRPGTVLSLLWRTLFSSWRQKRAPDL